MAAYVRWSPAAHVEVELRRRERVETFLRSAFKPGWRLPTEAVFDDAV
jgi:hypothetical protein